MEQGNAVAVSVMVDGLINNNNNSNPFNEGPVKVKPPLSRLPHVFLELGAVVENKLFISTIL